MVVTKKMLAIICFTIATFLMGVAVGHCKIPPGTPGDTVCSADLDAAACKRFTSLLVDFGHDLTVVEGMSLATVAQLKQKTFMVAMKCVDCRGNIHDVVVWFVKDSIASIKVAPTEKRRLGA